MKRLRKSLIAGLALSCVLTSPVRAQEADAQDKSTDKSSAKSSRDILTQIPSEALGAFVIRNAGQFDQQLLGLLQRLNLPPQSALAMAKGMSGLLSGVDDGGSIALVMMPIVDFSNPAQGMAIFVPSEDYDVLITQLAPEDVEGETLLKKVMLVDQISYVTRRGSFAVFGASMETVKKLALETETPGVRKSWTAHQLERFASDDITAWINLEAVVNHPMVAGMLQMYAGISGGAFDMEEIKASRSLTVSLDVADAGIEFGVYTSTDPQSESGKLSAKAKVSDKTLLTGLPGGDYALAVGLTAGPPEARAMSESVGQLLANPALAMQTDPQQLQEVSTLLTGMIAEMRGVSFSFAPLPESPEGLIGMTKVVTVSGGAKDKCQKLAELVAMLPRLVRNEEMSEHVRSALTYTTGAENVLGVSVDHLTLAMDQIPDVPEEDRDQLRRIVGREGVLFRLAAVGDTHILASFGGGKDRLAQTIELVRAGSAPLADDAGIKKAASQMRRKRSIEGYLAAAGVLKGAVAISKVLGDPPRFPMPDVNVPIAMVSGPVGAGEYQIDLMIPVELIIAVKDAALSMEGGAPPPQPAEPR